MVLNVAAMIGLLEDLAVSDQIFLDNCFTQDGDTNIVEVAMDRLQRLRVQDKLSSMAKLRTKNTLFEHYLYAFGKHKLHDLKIETSVSPEGLLVDMSDYQLGSVVDLTILRNRIRVHREALKKTDTEMSVVNHGEQINTHRTMWAF
ncbi:hypothetical protein H257_12875 [Aphanomyces astaci]|uniref:DDE Tnp4 domain-containing protein n=1 Tax=Aphanomyces astaci TaxID=112090 RepID=W4FYN5_APHAT|nr:hypothetical protein H257_12875 [Aphanomyces astaci]ETV72091.1 hypothetical protein H257_12875 [Aphanomyces astaci]|eukprot:XP_009838534.1 hypothetical protein H257_12875 [Aphanomyces astaci]